MSSTSCLPETEIAILVLDSSPLLDYDLVKVSSYIKEPFAVCP